MFSSEALKTHLQLQLDAFSSDIQIHLAFDEVTLTISSHHYYSVCECLRDDPLCPFKMMIDLCGVDYLYWPHTQGRFAVVLHLLSLEKNSRLRLRCFCTDNDRPSLPSVVDIWPTANWFERETFDLFGIVFRGHPDLRRILTDYGFSGHPFRKDFPVSGYVEMHYSEKEKRVAYQPVTIEPRMNVPRIVREDNYAYPVKDNDPLIS